MTPSTDSRSAPPGAARRLHPLSLALALLVAGCGPTPSAPRAALPAPAPVEKEGPAVAAPAEKWATVRRGTLRVTVGALGTFRARRTTQIGPQVSGRVAEVLVEEGDIVQAEQELVRLDSALFRIELDQRRAALSAGEAGLESLRQKIATAEAEITQAEVSLRDAELQWQRMRNLWEKPGGEAPSIPRKLYDDAALRRDQAAAGLEAAKSRRLEAEARLRESEAGLQQAREAVRWAEERLRETVVRAPYAAVVVHRWVHPGEAVNSAPVTRLLELQETGVLELDFPLPQPLLSRIGVGAPVEFAVEGLDGFRGEGQVAVVLPTIDESTRTFRCRVRVENRDGRLRPGLLAQVRAVESEARDVVIVPRRALLETAAGVRVAVEVDGASAGRTISIGRRTEEEAEVLEGLREGDRVLLVGE